MTSLRLIDDRAQESDTIPFPTRTRRMVSPSSANDSIHLVEDAFQQVERTLARLRAIANEPLMFPVGPEDDGPRAA